MSCLSITSFPILLHPLFKTVLKLRKRARVREQGWRLNRACAREKPHAQEKKATAWTTQCASNLHRLMSVSSKPKTPLDISISYTMCPTTNSLLFLRYTVNFDNEHQSQHLTNHTHKIPRATALALSPNHFPMTCTSRECRLLVRRASPFTSESVSKEVKTDGGGGCHPWSPSQESHLHPVPRHPFLVFSSNTSCWLKFTPSCFPTMSQLWPESLLSL